MEQHRTITIADGRGRAVRTTEHPEAHVVVLSLWNGAHCVGTVHLEAGQARDLSAWLTGRCA